MSAAGSPDGLESAGADSNGVGEDAENAPVPLLRPADGLPEVTSTADALTRVATSIASGSGPVAVDAERASGFRYSQRAYLVQLRREGAGTALVDPIPLSDLTPLARALDGPEWVLHAASQDLPCLAELGLRPTRLFDTELAGRLAGLPRVGLGPMVENLLGLSLEKGHGAADWSRRPLPEDWLVYAALDVEVLVALRDRLTAILAEQGKTEWAEQEFEAVRLAPPPAPRAEPWRRTSGIHKVRKPRPLAAVRALWQARDALAEERDIAPGRVLPDAAIVDAAVRNPGSADDLGALPVFRGRAQRRLGSYWFDALRSAAELSADELPRSSAPGDGPPPVARWADRDPDAAARLSASRAELAAIGEERTVPAENLLQPDLLRRLCWEPPADGDIGSALAAGGARPWQVELLRPVLERTLAATG